MASSKYSIKMTFIRDVLGTNPLDPAVLDTHIHQKQREIIMGLSKPNKEISKYLDAIVPSKAKTDAEIENIMLKIQDMLGYDLTEDQKKLVMEGKLSDLKETFRELDIKATTVFFFDQESQLPMIGDHMIYGFMKEASDNICSMARASSGKTEKEVILKSKNYTHSCINRQVKCDEEFIKFDRDIKRDGNGDPIYLHRSLRAKTPQGERIALVKSEQVPMGASIEITLRIQEGSPLTEDVLRKIFDQGEFIGFGQWRNAKHGTFEYEMKKLK